MCIRMFVSTILFIETFYYYLVFPLIGCLVLKFVMNMKLTKKNYYFLFKVALRIGFDPMSRRYSQDQGQGKGFADPCEG